MVSGFEGERLRHEGLLRLVLTNSPFPAVRDQAAKKRHGHARLFGVHPITRVGFRVAGRETL